MMDKRIARQRKMPAMMSAKNSIAGVSGKISQTLFQRI